MTSILLLYENRLYEITAGKFDKQILCRRYFADLVLCYSIRRWFWSFFESDFLKAFLTLESLDLFDTMAGQNKLNFLHVVIFFSILISVIIFDP